MLLGSIREALDASPFRPFAIRLANGRQYKIKHPDYAMLSPTGRSMMVYTVGDRAAAINLSLVTEVLRRADAAKSS